MSFNRLVKYLSNHYGMSTATECVFRRDKKVILKDRADELFLEILLEKPAA